MRYQITRAHLRDLSRVKPLWKAMLSRYVDVIGPTCPVRNPGEAWARRHEEYLNWLNDGAGVVYLATDSEDSDRVVGYAALHFRVSGSAFDMGERFGELESLAVSEDVRGQGLGSRLLEACRLELQRREIRYWSLDTLAANENARRMYERAGFEPFMLRMIRLVADTDGVPAVSDPPTAPLVMPTDQVGVPDSAGDRGAAASWRSERSPETDPVVGDSATSVVSLSVQEAGVRARAAAREMAVATTAQKNRALRLIADALETESESLLAANAKDVRRAEEAGRPESLVDRLRLDQGRLRGIAEAVRQVAELADPVGEVVRGSIRPNGLQVREQRVPFGVVGMIFEARPNVTVDAAALCLKSGNAVVLRGSSHAVESNRALVGVMRAALERTDIPADAVRLLDGDRDEAAFLMKARGLVDVIVPRGGAELIRTVVEESSVPVIETGSGNVHLYVDAAADLTKALDILMNAKTQRPSVCNAVETLLVHEKVAEALLDAALPALHAAGVVVHGDRVVRELASRVGAPVEEVTHEDWACEYHGLEIAVGVVDSLDTAMKHVARYSTGHTEAIVTEDRGAARRWTQGVDAAVVMVNASTRFTDGGEFGFGAEIGISTQKMHARGPMGLRELTSTKWIVEGDGQIRD
ncbi:glutamate-5-semialdehyde dehydrogenase [Austwickia chelonae]|uniref:Gamma-glutamyl phosphate reductase n=2 Tax=Austwickia TaxID=1184606 RepID=K6W3Y4_9MICO|nr:glutamate-5-semialdehyde dehydrogenase [Austwickia chelonae]GAB76497.1 gamma-glutamyl phosphate reductase [Austwickia chelonae NBRC 105200]SEW25752.1 glutamate-5-semialdehyde dehydrogenase [Austwickia chelonae]